ncbi:MAG: tripartite tricarboxylate transporter substrate binding protein [Burkholderiaceae bacterium]
MNSRFVASRRTAVRTLMSAPLLAAVAPAVRAQSAASGLPADWPSRPIRIVVGFPAGSATDVVARVMAEQLRHKLGQPAIVENRPGANGMLGASEVARAQGDGYTMLMTNSSAITVNHQVYKKITYLPERDFVPLTMVVSAPFIIVVNPAKERTADVRTVADLVALAKAHPGQITYGSGGVGNLAQLGFELINNQAGIRTAHVPYKGGAAAQTGLLGGEIDVMLDTPPTIAHVKSGRLRALAVTIPRRLPELPDVPTMIESGFPGFDVPFWLGALMPASTPPAIVQALYDAMKPVRDDANAMRQLGLQGTVELMPPAEFAARIKSETAMWGEVIRREKIEIE